MTIIFRKLDPKGLVLKHCEHVSISWPYAHEKWLKDIFIENVQDQKEIEKIKAHPNVIYFAFLTLEYTINIMNKGSTSNK
jgi:hypothetical protein